MFSPDLWVGSPRARPARVALAMVRHASGGSRQCHRYAGECAVWRPAVWCPAVWCPAVWISAV